MTTPRKRYASMDAYIASFSGEAASRLTTVRGLVHELAPDATEAISYGIPAFKLHGRILIYFGGFKGHIGVYPPMSETAPFKADLARYEGPKGAIRFPLDEPLPLPLLRRMIRFRVEENRQKDRPPGAARSNHRRHDYLLSATNRRNE